jgi:hypothetical protein
VDSLKIGRESRDKPWCWAYNSSDYMQSSRQTCHLGERWRLVRASALVAAVAAAPAATTSPQGRTGFTLHFFQQKQLLAHTTLPSHRRSLSASTAAWSSALSK